MSSRVYRWADIGKQYDGPHATPTRTNVGPYFLNISSLNNGRLDLSQSDHVSEADFEKWTRRVTPQADDLLFSYETRLGEAALMPEGVEACLGRRMALLRPNIDLIVPRYLLYYYLSPGFQRLIGQNAIHGATVDRISLSTMGSWELDLPPLAEQQAIAEVLGALDDKIIANTRAATTADALATTLFTQAVRSAPVSDRAFADVARISGGGTPSTKNPSYWNGDVSWATPTDVTGLSGPYLEETERTITDAGLQNSASELYPAGSILMTSRATIGAFALAQKPMAVNQGFIVVQPHDPSSRYWIFHEMRSRVDEFTSFANGATFLELSRGNFRRFKVRLGDTTAMAMFNRSAETLHDAARNSLCENNFLETLRSSLLPQMMSGSLQVKDAEKVVDEVV